MSPQTNNEAAPTGIKPILPILIGLLVVAAGVIAFLVFGKPKVEVPDILYSERAEAGEMLSKAGLKLGTVTEQEDPQVPIGDLVIKATPEVGTTVEEGSTVDVVISKGPKLTDSVDVPDLKGLSPEEAEKKLYDAFLIPQPGKQVYSNDVEAGKVCAQSVEAGSKAQMLSIITYNTSLGKEKVKVPNVAGKPIDEARKTLNDAGLSIDTTNSYSDEVAKDVVISQSIAADKEVDKGSTVTLEVSLGKKPAVKVIVPNIISYTRDDAIRALQSAGLKYVQTGDDTGTVVSVKPAPNTQVDQGSTVTFEVKRPEEKKQQTQPSQQQQQQPQPQPDPEPEPADGQVEIDGFAQNYSEDECISIAHDFAGAGGQAKGRELDTTVDGPITGGGTIYYRVEFNLGDVHYTIEVDAVGGDVISGMETFDGVNRLLDKDGNVIPGSEQPA